MKNYLLTLISAVTDKAEEQDALEWAIYDGRYRLTANLARDTAALRHHLTHYTDLYRRLVLHHEDQLLELLGAIDDYQ